MKTSVPEPVPELEPNHNLRRALICTRWATAALVTGVAAQLAAAAGAAAAGSDSPVRAATPFLLFGAVVLGVLAAVAFMVATVLKADPAVQLAYAEIEREEALRMRRRLASTLEKMDAHLRAHGKIPAPERSRPRPGRRRQRVDAA